MDAKTLILGNSRDAREIAEELLEKDGDVIVAMPADIGNAGLFDDLHAEGKAGELEILPVAGSVSCSGSVGRFSLTVNGNGHAVTRTVSSIVIADEVTRDPNFSLYGVAPSRGVVSLSQFCAMIEAKAGQTKKELSGKRIAFLTGLVEESNPVITEEIMRCALKLHEEFNCQTYLFTGNLKVAGNGLEALYRQTKKAGTVYMKFTETTPDIQVHKDGNISISYVDEIIRETFKLNPDVTVVDETLQPSAFSQDLSKRLEIDTGPDGFGQSDNVHRATVFTNRKGIFVAASSRLVQTEAERQADVSSAALAVLNLYNKLPESNIGKAEITFTGHCVGCLTCFRSSPYGAISLSPKVAVDPQACEGCGICTAECPRFAIKINAPDGEAISERIPDGKQATQIGDFNPSITAFCCSRSAKGAGDLASCMGYDLPSGLKIVEVPCAGAVSRDHLFTAFSKGADGVLVLTCHKGNCHSEYGNVYAHQRVDQLSDMLPQLGFESGRLAYKTLASNMGTEFAEIVNAFEHAVLELGPSRLKPKG
ncbi:MAG: hydrogenase iron-sulfur subunit [Deltaproteobacteria bacterium]|nr:hydrogenase iron-sulfur subunit [Deltaproteobacteria bacterium]